MADERRCEECLELPGSDGTCTTHPYARLIWISPEDAREEQALLRNLRRSRLKAAAVIFGVFFLVFAFIGMSGGPGPFVFMLFLLLSFLAALHFPAALMWSHGRLLRTGDSGIPLWLRTILVTVAGVLLSILIVLGVAIDDRFRVGIEVLATGPVLMWLLGAGSLLRGKRAQRQRRSSALSGSPLQAGASDAVSAKPRPRRQTEIR